MVDQPVIDLDETPFVFLHKTGCGRPAFRLVARPSRQMRSADARHMDGRRIPYGSPVMCDHCGAQIELHPRSRDVIEVYRG